MLRELTATNISEETRENMERMKRDVKLKRVLAEKARKEYEQKLHEYESQKELYNLLVKSLNHNCNK